MIRKILVALDRSETSTRAFQSAITLAQKLDAELKLVHVLADSDPGAPQRLSYTSEHYYPLLNTALVEAYEHDWNQFVEAYQTWLSQQAEVAHEADLRASCELAYGSPGSALCHAAATWSADLLVVGSRGRTGLGEMVLGSVSNYVMHHAPCSVVVIHTRDELEAAFAATRQGRAGQENQLAATADSTAPTALNRILVPMDRSLASAEALEDAIALAKSHGAALQLLHVLVDGEPGSPKAALFSDSQYMIQHSSVLLNQYEKEWNNYVNDWWVWLQARVKEIQADGIEVSCDVSQGLAGGQICQAAQAWNADLIVMGARGLSGLKELLMGSTSYYVSHRAPCSVWVSHPKRSVQDVLQIKQARRHADFVKA
ncbi:MAG: universal stress protein [Cyanobacteria bacterium J06628_6]